jgi:hypothetical protein
MTDGLYECIGKLALLPEVESNCLIKNVTERRIGNGGLYMSPQSKEEYFEVLCNASSILIL